MLKFCSAAAVAALSVAACACAGAAQAQQTYAFVEYDSQWDMQMIGVQAAYERGYTGQGVVVGVVDSGINPTHRDIADNLTDISLDIYTGGPVLADPQGHGTHVAGTIAGVRNGVGVQGVAYDAQLAIFRLLDENNVANGPDDAIATLLNYGLDRGVRIFNNSWGGQYLDRDGTAADVTNFYGETVIAAYQRAVDLDSILVWASGNESLLQPGLQAGLPYYFPEWQPHWLTVTAVGSDGVLASYANHCGLAAQWCLAAPGGDAALPGETLYDAYIWSAGNTNVDDLSGQGGTSMAAPHVTGAVAIARQMFPNAPAAALTRLVLATATDLGDPGVDESYGWGLLNVENMVSARDPEAGSVFANGASAADAGQTVLIEALNGRLTAGEGAGAWAAVLGGRADHDVTDASLASEAETFGAAVGYDFDTTPGARFGLSLSASRTTADEALHANSARIRSVGLSAYMAARRGRLFADASTGLDIRQYDFRRRAIVGADGTVLQAAGALDGRSESDGYGAFARARFGAAFDLGALEVRPFVHARLSHQQIDAFAETGADVFSLNVEATRLTRYEAGPGVELAAAPRPMGGALVGGSLSVRYDARWGDDEFALPVRMLGSSVPAAVGDLDDAVTVAGSVSARLSGGWDVAGRGWWSGGDDHDSVGATIGLRLAF